MLKPALFLALFAVVTLAAGLIEVALADNPTELGRVNWQRDYDAAMSRAREAGKPVFLQFQEIPGCATCIDFGESVLSHPLVVAAIEEEFVPLAIYNNRDGRDAEILNQYNEPSWNNPVVRFVDADGNDVIPRKDAVWSTHGIATRMIEALEAADRNVPGYLRIAHAETQPKAPLERATFAMHCYWEGEARLGGLDGVIATQAAWLDGKEVVEVHFDPRKISYKNLLEAAQTMQCASTVFARSDEQYHTAQQLAEGNTIRTNEASRAATEPDQLSHLQQSPLRYLPLTPMQAMKANAAIRTSDIDTLRHWLTPAQWELAAEIQQALMKNPNALDGLSKKNRPETIEKLAEYEAQLRERLDEVA